MHNKNHDRMFFAFFLVPSRRFLQDIKQKRSNLDIISFLSRVLTLRGLWCKQPCTRHCKRVLAGQCNCFYTCFENTLKNSPQFQVWYSSVVNPTVRSRNKIVHCPLSRVLWKLNDLLRSKLEMKQHLSHQKRRKLSSKIQVFQVVIDRKRHEIFFPRYEEVHFLKSFYRFYRYVKTL